jgi:hypothetical protein
MIISVHHEAYLLWRISINPLFVLIALWDTLHLLITPELQTWFISQLVRLRQLDEDSHAHEMNAESSTSELSAYPSHIPPMSPTALEEDLKLPLTGAMVLYVNFPCGLSLWPSLTPCARRYDSLLRTYDQLAELVLWTIRLDIRCRTLHALQKGMREVCV